MNAAVDCTACKTTTCTYCLGLFGFSCVSESRPEARSWALVCSSHQSHVLGMSLEPSRGIGISCFPVCWHVAPLVATELLSQGDGKPLLLRHWWMWPPGMSLNVWCPFGLHGLQCFGLLECGARWRRWAAARRPQAQRRCCLPTSPLRPRLFLSSLWGLIIKTKHRHSCWPQDALCN